MTVIDFSLLDEASKRLHGYLLHTWFRHYLGLIAGNLQRWSARGLVGNDGQPSAETDFAAVLDLDSIDLEKVTYIVGFCLYIFASHKKANYFLTQEDEKKRVLYLRGFDYEGATRTGGTLAVGYSSLDTTQFSHRLADHLHPELEIFTALSPRDLFWETIAPRYFYGDYDRLIQICSNPIRSMYLNANHWQTDIADLAARMDSFVVYVSSITESVLWELELLKMTRREDRTIVVFDEEAIATKEIQAGVQQRMRELYGNDVIWTKSGPKTDIAPEALRDSLARTFTVVSPDDFFAEIEQQMARLGTARGGAGDGSRHTPLPFRFHPAVEVDTLRTIEAYAESVEASIREQISSRSITNLLWFLNQVQLAIFISLMLGRQDDTGRALAVYAAVFDVVQKHFDGLGARTAGERKGPMHDTLLDHLEMARYASSRLMAHGQYDEFGDHSARALQTYNEVFTSASAAVESFLVTFRQKRS